MQTQFASRALVEDLAIATREGFGAVDQRLDGMGRRFDAVNERFDVHTRDMEEQFGTLFNRAYSIFTTKQELEATEIRILTGME